MLQLHINNVINNNYIRCICRDMFYCDVAMLSRLSGVSGTKWTKTGKNWLNM